MTQNILRRPPPNRIRDLKNVKFGDKGVDLDPELEFVVGKILDSGWSPERISREVEKLGYKLSPATIIGWLYGATRRPQNMTVTLVMRAIGYEKHWLDRNAQ